MLPKVPGPSPGRKEILAARKHDFFIRTLVVAKDWWSQGCVIFREKISIRQAKKISALDYRAAPANQKHKKYYKQFSQKAKTPVHPVEYINNKKRDVDIVVFRNNNDSIYINAIYYQYIQEHWPQSKAKTHIIKSGDSIVESRIVFRERNRVVAIVQCLSNVTIPKKAKRKSLR